MQYTTIENKHGIVYIGMQRYYREGLSERDFTLENCTPYSFKIKDKTFLNKAWGGLLAQVVNYLINEYNKSESELLDFSVDWTNQKIFMLKGDLDSHRLLENNLYLNTNHTAMHCCWLLQDILNFYKVNLAECELLIKRKPIAEVSEVKDYYKQMVRQMYMEYLKTNLGMISSERNQYLSTIDKLDIHFKKSSKTFESLYLIDDKRTFANCKSNFLKYIISLAKFDLKQMEIIESRLECYTKFMYATFK